MTQTAKVTLAVIVPSFGLSAGATSVSLTAGGTAAVTLSTVAGSGFNSAIALSVSGLPVGVTANFAPPGIGAPGSGNSTLTLTAASSVTAGVYRLTVTSLGEGLTRIAPITLTVRVPSLTLALNSPSASSAAGGTATVGLSTLAGGGLNSAIALSVTGLPIGVTASFSPASIAAPGNGSSVLKLAVSSNVPAGLYTLTVTAAGGGVTKAQMLPLSVYVPNFALILSAPSASVTVGGTTTAGLSTLAISGFNSAIALAVTGLPTGVTASFAPASIAAPGNGSSKLTLAAGAGAAAGTHTLVVTASGGGLTKTSLLVLTTSAPSFTLGLGASKVNLAKGGSLPITVSTAAAGGFKSAIALSIGGLPAGVTGKFLPASIAAPGNGSSALTLTAASTSPAGTYKLTVTGSGGGVTKTQPLTLTIAAH